MKIELTNFSLFQDNTLFDIKPLTFLIGANNSGKSTFIKALAIASVEQFVGNPHFNIDSIEYHIKDKSQPIVFRAEVNHNIFKELKWKMIDAPDGKAETLDLNSIIYKNSSHKDLLELEVKSNSFSLFDEVTEKQIKVTFDLVEFLKVLENITPKQDIEVLRMLFGNRLLEGKLNHPKELYIFIYDYRPFEKWFFEIGLITFLEDFALSPLDSKTKNLLNRYFKQIFNPLTNSNGYDVKKINFSTLRSSNLSKPQRIFNESEFIVNQITKGIGYFSIEEIDSDFVDVWMKIFFGKDYNLEVITPFENSLISEIKLNGRHFTELGTGICKILQYIYYFGTLSFYSTDLYLNTEEHKKENTKAKILKEKSMIGFNDAKFVVIEEPETNLHPDFQVLLAEMIYSISNQTRYHLIVETHSEYMIRTLQYLIAKNPETAENVGIINFGSGDEIGKVKNIEIESNGSLSDSFYSSFYHLAEDIKWKISALNHNHLN